MMEEELSFGPLFVAFSCGIFSIILIYWYSTKNHDYWKKRGIPYAKPIPILGTSYEIITKCLHEIEYKRYFEFGPVYGHFEVNKPALSVADPALLKDIFVKDFQFFTSRRLISTGDSVMDNMLSNIKGEDWKRIRNIMTPTFSTGKLKRMMSIFKECSTALVQNFRKATEKGESVDAKSLYGAFTMDVIASSAFSTKIDSHNDPENMFVKSARNIFTQKINWRFVCFVLCPGLLKFFNIPLIPPTTIKFFKETTMQIIEERKRTGQSRNDFLQLLLDTAKDVEQEQKLELLEKEKDIASNYGEQDTSDQIFKNMSNKTLSMDELVAQCVVFFIGGYDTTASTLAFASYLLALNPRVQDKLRADVDEALKETKGEMTYDAIQNMKYLDNVISETLRMYPPSFRQERVADADYKLGDTGITIPKGMLVTIPNYAMQRDPKIYPDPEKFEPNRFTPEERAERDQYAYLPFGSGPRNCVGMRYALIQMKVCLAQVIANFKIKRSPQTKIPLQFYKNPGLLHPKGIILDMEIRKDSPLIK